MTRDDTPPTEPRRIGPYKLIDILGEGGMGVVYLAEQSEPIRRRVALKILKPGMDTKQVLARFESERQALAVMDHPNIARALDGGMTDDGRPFFVMELVHGTPITQYADTHRLNTTERLRLFLDVCRAVQHAHLKGVIHRDLKPSNVLVCVQDTGPVVKVIDFGIAKAVGLGLTERTLVTRAGQILGTPEYMSPEQAEMSGLDVDTRTDVYSLGVMLYELVVGALPFDLSAKPDYAIQHTLRERDVPRPSTRLTGLGHTLPTVARYRRATPDSLRKEVKGDLDWIILKAMEKDRTRRYDTANGLAMDIERHLADEPVLARPPSTRDKVGKFVRRNRAAVVPAAVAALALLAGASAALLGYRQAVVEQARAEQSAATAEQVTEFLVELFQINDPGETRGSQVTAREVLDRGAARIRTELAAQPEIQGRLMRTMAQVYRNLGLYAPAAALLEEAVAILDSGTTDRDRRELAQALEGLGIVYRRQGRTAEARDALNRAMEVTRARGETDTPVFASTVRGLANVYQRAGRYAEAEPLLREALVIQERLLGPDHPEVGLTLSNLGAMFIEQRRPADAEPYVRRALRIAEREHGPEHLYVAEELVMLGAIYSLQGRATEAEAAYQRAHAILARTLDPDHPTMGLILHNLGEASLQRGAYAEAEDRLVRALDIKVKALGPRHVSVAGTLKWLGKVYHEQGRYQDAEARYVEALGIYDQATEHPAAAVRETLEGYARLLRATGRDDEASATQARAERLTDRSSSPR